MSQQDAVAWTFWIGDEFQGWAGNASEYAEMMKASECSAWPFEVTPLYTHPTTAQSQQREALMDQLREALLELRRDSDGVACWCEMAIGNPMVHGHSKGCELARAALPATTDTVLLTPDEIQEMHDDGRLSFTEGEG